MTVTCMSCRTACIIFSSPGITCISSVDPYGMFDLAIIDGDCGRFDFLRLGVICVVEGDRQTQRETLRKARKQAWDTFKTDARACKADTLETGAEASIDAQN